MQCHRINVRALSLRLYGLSFIAFVLLLPWATTPAMAGPGSQLASPPAGQALTATPALRQVSLPGYFEVSVPTGWSRYRPSGGINEVERGVHELAMLGPRSSEGPRTEIAVSYFAPDNHISKTVDKFLQLNAHPVMVISGETFGEVREEQLNGHKVLRFEKLAFEFLPHYAVHPKEIPVHE